jgi:hypothetical protein
MLITDLDEVFSSYVVATLVIKEARRTTTNNPIIPIDSCSRGGGTLITTCGRGPSAQDHARTRKISRPDLRGDRFDIE